jgi:hypothetical protein
MLVSAMKSVLALSLVCLSGCASSETAMTRFRDGDLVAREPALLRLRDSARDPQGGYQEARGAAEQLYSFYGRRAERQQVFMDLGSVVTVTGAAGAFEGGISTSTRTAWAIAAFTPTLISQFNAYEPTRELFHGGGLALHLITARYDRVVEAVEVAGMSQPPVDCSAYGQVATRVRGWAQVPARKDWDPGGAIAGEADRLHWSCIGLSQRMEELRSASRFVGDLKPRIAAAYAKDILRLDHAIMGQDRELRYTPSETLSALISGPLRAADMLLTGTSTKAAVDSIATLNAFRGLNQTLSVIDLPPMPAPADPTPGLSAIMRERMTSGATPPDVSAALRELHTRHQQLARSETDHAFRVRAARGVFAAAAADELTFSYDVSTRTTIVKLGAPQLQPGSQASTSASPPVL